MEDKLDHLSDVDLFRDGFFNVLDRFFIEWVFNSYRDLLLCFIEREYPVCDEEFFLKSAEQVSVGSYILNYHKGDIELLAQYNVPDGWIIGSGKDRNFTPYGTVDYPFPLTKEQQDHYSMTPVLRSIHVHQKEGHPQMEVWTDHTKSADDYRECYATYGEFTGWLQAEGYEYVTEDGFIVVLGKGDDCLSTYSHEPRNCLTYDYGEMPLYDVSAWNFVNVEDKE